MTEDEAKQKWCPLTASRLSRSSASSRAETRCIGSECMMFRLKLWPMGPAGNPWSASQATYYCGLAGEPTTRALVALPKEPS